MYIFLKKKKAKKGDPETSNKLPLNFNIIKEQETGALLSSVWSLL
jgi:hypothetical protein